MSLTKINPRSFRSNADFDVKAVQEIVAYVLDYARQQGATSAESRVTISRGFSVSVRCGKLENILNHQSSEIGIGVYFGKRRGVTATTDLSQTAIEMAVAKACHIAKYNSEDHFAGLPEKNILAFRYPDLKLYYPCGITIDQAKKMVLAAEKVGFTLKNKNGIKVANSEGFAFDYAQNYSAYGNSLGFYGAYPTSLYSLSGSFVAGEGDNMQRDGSYRTRRDPAELPLIAADVGCEAARDTLQKFGAKSIATGKYPVIFQAKAAKNLLGIFAAAISGANLYQDASFLCGSLNKKVFPQWVKISERPHLKSALGSAPFDAEGVKTCSRDIVSDGYLKSYILDTYTARKMQLASTGNGGGVHNLIINHSGQNFEALLKKMKKGLVITEAMGQGINIITGDYSRGVSGFWVEDGEIKFPVEGITLAGNLKDMFKNIVAIGKDIDRRGGNVTTGSIMIEGMTVAG